jgi:hypothetical protein
VEGDKPGIMQWAGSVAAAGAGDGITGLKAYTPSPQARRVADGELSYSDGLRGLAGANGDPRRYRTAAGIIGSDLPYWSVVSDSVGAKNVDSLMTNYSNKPVPGVTDFTFDSLNYGEKLALSDKVDKMMNRDETGRVMDEGQSMAGDGGYGGSGELYAAAGKGATGKGKPSNIHRSDVLQDERVLESQRRGDPIDKQRNVMIGVAKEVFDKARDAAGQEKGTADETPARCYEKDGKQFCVGRATFYTAPEGKETTSKQKFKAAAKAGAMNEIYVPYIPYGQEGKLQCVKVTNLDDPSRSLDKVVINDRGVYEPIGGKNREEYEGVKYISHRNVIDLTPGAFKDLGGTKEPLHVEVEFQGECTGSR